MHVIHQHQHHRHRHHQQHAGTTNGRYDDTTFLVGVDDAVLQSIGIPSTLTGRAHIKKMLDAIEKLPRNILQESIPPTVQEWLDALSLGQYASHFIRMGYSNTDLPLFEGLVLRDLRQMGIVKPAHQDKLVKAIGKLNKLLEQGRSPEGKSMADIEEGETREMVLRLKEVPLESTFLSKRMVLMEEESFWTQMVSAVLNPRLDSISNVSGLKGKLRNLRNIGVTVLFLLNATWMAMMLELTGGLFTCARAGRVEGGREGGGATTLSLLMNLREKNTVGAGSLPHLPTIF